MVAPKVITEHLLQKKLYLNVEFQNTLHLNSGTHSSANFSSQNHFLQELIGLQYTLQ